MYIPHKSFPKCLRRILMNVLCVSGGASVAKGVSVYLDSMFNNAMADYFRSIFPMDFPFLAPYVDLFALAISVIVCGE